MSVLVTGVNGLVGVHVARILAEKGHRVVGHDLNPHGELAYYPEVEKAITFVWGDITQLTHLLEVVEKHQVEGVIHLASVRNEVRYKACPAELMRVNLSGVQNLLELARLGKIKKIILASTAAVYGKVADPRAPITEDHPLNPVGIYANSKAMCESLFRCYRNVYGVESVIVRLSRVWGRLANLDSLEFGNPLSSFVSKALGGIPIDDPSGADFGGDFAYAPDVAMGFYRAYVTPKPPEWIYHIGCGTLYLLSEVAEILRDLVPGAKISLGPGMLPYVTQSPTRGPIDIRRAERDLGYRVQHDLRGALEHFIDTVRTRSNH